MLHFLAEAASISFCYIAHAMGVKSTKENAASPARAIRAGACAPTAISRACAEQRERARFLAPLLEPARHVPRHYRLCFIADESGLIAGTAMPRRHAMRERDRAARLHRDEFRRAMISAPSRPRVMPLLRRFRAALLLPATTRIPRHE